LIITQTNYIDLKDYILKDFKDIVEDIEDDYEMGIELKSECYIFKDNNEVLGYMCFFLFPEFTYISYTKAYDRKVHKTGYTFIRNIYNKLKDQKKPLLVDSNSNVYSNHIVKHKLPGLFQIIL